MPVTKKQREDYINQREEFKKKKAELNAQIDQYESKAKDYNSEIFELKQKMDRAFAINVIV